MGREKEGEGRKEERKRESKREKNSKYVLFQNSVLACHSALSLDWNNSAIKVRTSVTSTTSLPPTQPCHSNVLLIFLLHDEDQPVSHVSSLTNILPSATSWSTSSPSNGGGGGAMKSPWTLWWLLLLAHVQPRTSRLISCLRSEGPSRTIDSFLCPSFYNESAAWNKFSIYAIH